MKKSVYTFGLLKSSLVMLAIVPILNNNTNQYSFLHPAVAQGYGYQNDYGYTNYSTYPTDDKKYECRTGPFEGFFVSSVEFCNHGKFDKDDRKDVSRDNRTGTQGPPGPAGPQGPPGINGTNGAIGPSGITQLNNTTTYTITSPIILSGDDDAIGEGIAVCDIGDYAISGGYTLNNQSPKNVEFFTVTDSPLGDNAWKVRTFSNFGGIDIGGNVTAKCFDNPPLRP